MNKNKTIHTCYGCPAYYSDSDQIQVKIGGKQYLVHSTNVALISE